MTSDPSVNLTSTGDVTIVQTNITSVINVQTNMTSVIQVTNGGYVTFPADPCLRDLDLCLSGFTLSIVVSVVHITDETYTIITTGGEVKGTSGRSRLSFEPDPPENCHLIVK